jgi:hypothetical protein
LIFQAVGAGHPLPEVGSYFPNVRYRVPTIREAPILWEHNAPCTSENVRKTGENPKKLPLFRPKNHLGRPLVDRPQKRAKEKTPEALRRKASGGCVW